MKRRGIYGGRNIGQIRRTTMLRNGAGQAVAKENVKEKAEKKAKELSDNCR